MNTVKKQFLEHLVRMCARELIIQINENNKSNENVIKEDEHQGITAPPAEGQGTGDQPPIPKSKESNSDLENRPEEQTHLQGINLINPRDKSQIKSLSFPSPDDSTIEQIIHRAASAVAGPKVKIALATMRAIKSALRNPSIPLFLYVGKFDPESEELFVMADNSLAIAKNSSVPPEELLSGQSDFSAPSPFNPTTASGKEFGDYMNNAHKTTPVNVDEITRSIIKKMVNEILNQNETPRV